jgi:hypothetical protein
MFYIQYNNTNGEYDMEVQIMVKTEEKGNPRRGYHDSLTTITFLYGVHGRYSEGREQQIVELLTSKGGSMWWSVKNHTVSGAGNSVSEYTVNHGYDSGD